MSRARSSKRSFSAGRALALLPLSLLTMMGCSSLIGLDGYSVAKGGSGGQVSGGGDGGSGGRAGGTASGGRSGSSGAGRSGGGESGGAGKGAAGEAGSGGTGVAGSQGVAGGGAMSEGGQAGAPPVPLPNVGCDGKTTFTVNDNVIRSCLLRAGCNPNVIPVRTISECVSKNTQAALPGESCNVTSKTCADYEACEHIGIAHDDLCGGTQVTRCDANGRAINCGNYDVDEFIDCKGQGETCAVFTWDDADSTVYADCVVSAATSACASVDDEAAYFCQPGTATVPDAYYYCYQGEAYGESCGKSASCIADTSGAEPDAGCYFDFQAQCTGQADSASCSNGVAKVCSAEDLISYDCTSVGLACATKANSTDGYCVAPGCTPTKVDNCEETCGDDGTTLTFCYGGVPYSVDCTAYGFTSCYAGIYGDQDAPFAACR